MRQHGAIDPLRPQNIDVVLLGELLRGESLGRAEHHVTGIVNEYIDAGALGDDLFDGGVGRSLGLDVELDRADVGAGERGKFGGVLRVAAGDIAHGRIDGVAGAAESFGGQAAETAGSAGDEDDLGHDEFLSFFSRGEGVGLVG